MFVKYNLFILINFILVLNSFSYIVNNFDNQKCTINVREELDELAPILLKSKEAANVSDPDLDEFVTPNNAGLVVVSVGDSIRLACPGKTNYVTVVPIFPEVKAVCDYTGLFSVFERDFNVSDLLQCYHHITHVTYQDDNGTIYIGFNLLDKKQISLIEIYYDAKRHITNRTVSFIPSAIKERQPGREAVDFNAVYYDLPIRELYELDVQRQTLIRLLGDNKTVSKYLADGECLTRGHLTAHSDFVYSAQQRATFYYVNTAPQWFAFNSGDWRQAEEELRDFASKCQRGVKIYTGTSGITTLPNNNGTETELYLFYDTYGNKSIPIPKYFWKVFIDIDNTTNARAYLGLNTPKSITPANQWHKGVCDSDNIIGSKNNPKSKLVKKNFKDINLNLTLKNKNFMKIGEKVVSCTLGNFHVPEFIKDS